MLFHNGKIFVKQSNDQVNTLARANFHYDLGIVFERQDKTSFKQSLVTVSKQSSKVKAVWCLSDIDF